MRPPCLAEYQVSLLGFSLFLGLLAEMLNSRFAPKEWPIGREVGAPREIS